MSGRNLEKLIASFGNCEGIFKNVVLTLRYIRRGSLDHYRRHLGAQYLDGILKIWSRLVEIAKKFSKMLFKHCATHTLRYIYRVRGGLIVDVIFRSTYFRKWHPSRDVDHHPMFTGMHVHQNKKICALVFENVTLYFWYIWWYMWI